MLTKTSDLPALTKYDVWQIAESDQTEVDPKTHATTLHTPINLDDGGEGFIILGRIVRDKEKVWKPLKDVIIRVYIEYSHETETLTQ